MSWTDKDLGPVDAYALAVEGGYTGTKEQWVNEIGNASTNAQTASTKAAEAEAWATGGTEGTPSETNNAKYYSEQSASSATTASDKADLAQAWATGGSGGTPSATNNCKYYRDSAAAIAAGDVIDDTAGAGDVDLTWSADKLNGLKSAFTQYPKLLNQLGIARIGFEDGVIPLQAVGQQLSNLNRTPSSTGMVSSLASCVSGDVFTVNIYGRGINGAGALAYGFLSQDLTVLSVASDNANIEGTLVAPDNAAYFVVNTRNVPEINPVVIRSIIDVNSEIINIVNIGKEIESKDSYVPIAFDTLDGCFVRYVDGTPNASSISSVTNFINVEAFDSILYKRRVTDSEHTTAGIAFYDREFRYLSGKEDKTGGSAKSYEDNLYKITVPLNATYVRCSTFTNVSQYGSFEIKGHISEKETIISSKNAVESINNIIFEKITDPSDTLTWELGTYNFMDGTKENDDRFVRTTGQYFVRAGSTVNVQDGYMFVVVMMSAEGELTFIDGKSHRIDGEFIVPQDCRIRLAIANKNDETQQATGIEENFILNLYRKPVLLEEEYTKYSDFVDATKYIFDDTKLAVSYGGVSSNGQATAWDTRIRFTYDGIGGIKVSKNSTITAKPGFKFNVALYSRYVSNSNNELIGYRGMSSDQYTVPYDCFIRFSVMTTSDDVLWTKDSDNKYTFTESGEAAVNGLVLNLYAGTIKEAIENVQSQISIDFWSIPNKLETEIPLNAVAFHALFDDLVTSGKISRSLLGKIGDDNDLPVYLYTLRSDMSHIDPDYNIVSWNGNNELYQRPKIFLSSGIHGNERTTPYVLYDFIRKLCENNNYQAMRNTFDWYFVPLVNPWGFSHTAIKISDGSIDKTWGYNSATKSQYNVIDNTSEIHYGIRCNEAGIDINRDFSTFATQEARIVRDTLDNLTADNRNFVFAVDSHQAFQGDYVNVIGAFLSLSYNATNKAKDIVYKKWMQAGAQTELIMSNYTDRENVQSVYAWDGTNLLTLRNYLASYSEYATCFEGGQTCLYYSQNEELSNKTARTFINTQYQLFMKEITKLWM